MLNVVVHTPTAVYCQHSNPLLSHNSFCLLLCDTVRCGGHGNPLIEVSVPLD